MIIVVGSMAAGRHFTGVVAKSLHLDLQVQSRENQLGVAWALETSKPAATRPHLLALLKHSTIEDEAFKYVGLWGPFSFRPPQRSSLYWFP